MADLISPRTASFNPALRGTQVTFKIIYAACLCCFHLRTSCFSPSTISSMTIETNPLHALVAFIFFVLLGFIQIRYPESPTPFQLHPKTIWLSIASFLLYCLAFLGRLVFAIRVHYFDTFMQVFGSLSLISLVSILLPDTWESFSFFMYTLWFITNVIATCRTRFREKWVLRQPQRRVVRLLLPTVSMDFVDIYIA